MERVLAGKTYVGGVLVAPGVVVAGTQGKETLIGELQAKGSARAERIAAVFNAAGLRTQVCEDILGTIWDKLLINVATGALSGITRLPYGALYQVPQVQACAVAAVEEAMAVARASGISLSYQHGVDAWRKAAAGLPYGFKASMLQSLEKGALTEIDFIHGAVVERGGFRLGPVDLDVHADDILVLKRIGPLGAPGMPEAGYLPIPRKLARAGVNRLSLGAQAFDDRLLRVRTLVADPRGREVLRRSQEPTSSGPARSARLSETV